MKLIDRDLYLKQLIDVYGTPDIKVITGVRRSGKSKLMEAFHYYLTKEYKDVNIIHINLIMPENENLKEYHALYDYGKEGIRKLYESCYRDNLHSLWAGQELYRKGNSEEELMNILQKNMQPVYDSARRQGYEVWNRG